MNVSTVKFCLVVVITKKTTKLKKFQVSNFVCRQFEKKKFTGQNTLGFVVVFLLFSRCFFCFFFFGGFKVMTSYMAIEVLERRLAARDKELKDRLERINQLESELSQRDALVRQLRADLDKCQQVLKPLNQVQQQQSTVLGECSVTAEMAQIAPWRVTANKNGPNASVAAAAAALLEPRFKRLAISAEPLQLPRSLLLANAAELKQSLPVNRQPKSAQ